MMLALCCFIMAWVTASLSLWLMLKTGWLIQTLDLPNHRSLHLQPVPRTGGIAILAGAYIGCIPIFFMDWQELPYGILLSIAVIALCLSGVSRLDDLFQLRPITRLSCQLVAAVALVGMIDGWPTGIVSGLVMLLLVLAVTWMTNLYNFMDGADGLAGGMAVMGFGTYALSAAVAQQWWFSCICLSIVGAALAFLSVNFHPAKMFMGDVGSVPLGFCAAALGFLGVRCEIWTPVFPLIVFMPFIFDATFTLLKRLLQRKKIWQAHREHFYQQLILSGLGHAKTAWLAYCLMLLSGGYALLIQSIQPIGFELTLLMIQITVFLLMAAMLTRHLKTTKAVS